MWNSPRKSSDCGKRYKLAELSALVLPLDELLNLSKSVPVAEVVDERILHQLERDEFVFALYQVLDALLEETELPKKGHTGIQEAIIAELLNQAHTKICCELDNPEFGPSARKAVWNSVDRLLLGNDLTPWSLEEMELPTSQPYLSEQLTEEMWNELLGEGGLWDEFLWDSDWRVDSLMDLPPDRAKSIAETTGLDLDVVQALPHTPSAAELRMAEHYVSYVIWKGEVVSEQGGQAIDGSK